MQRGIFFLSDIPPSFFHDSYTIIAMKRIYEEEEDFAMESNFLYVMDYKTNSTRVMVCFFAELHVHLGDQK